MAAALTVLESALEQAPDDAGIHLNLAMIASRRGDAAAAIAHLRAAARAEPENANVHYNLGWVLAVMVGDTPQAITEHKRALELQPSWPLPMLSLAWIYATSPDPGLRDPTEAVRLATSVGPEARTPRALDTLAAAYASAGRFEEAVGAVEEAIELAGNTGRTDFVATLQQRLRLYRQGKAFVALRR
jgi:spermidine synthase